MNNLADYINHYMNKTPEQLAEEPCFVLAETQYRIQQELTSLIGKALAVISQEPRIANKWAETPSKMKERIIYLVVSGILGGKIQVGKDNGTKPR